MRQVINGRVHEPDLLYVAGSSSELARVREFQRLAVAAGSVAGLTLVATTFVVVGWLA